MLEGNKSNGKLGSGVLKTSFVHCIIFSLMEFSLWALLHIFLMKKKEKSSESCPVRGLCDREKLPY